jgi:MFS transporter, ACS family, D-galactonate transporter
MRRPLQPGGGFTVAGADRPTRVRYDVLGMLFVTVVINYLDRSNLSLAAPGLTGDLGLDARQTGWLFSAFGWTYAAMQIPGGWLADQVGPRVLLGAICGLWSLATLGQGLAGTFGLILSLRLVVGMFEAPAYPICNRLVTTWFPERERAGAIAGYTAGQYVGLAFLTPVLVLAQKNLGWHALFILTGAAGLGWAVVWYWRYRDPAESARVNDAEIQYIQSGGGLAERHARPGAMPVATCQWADLRTVLSRRKLWGIYIGQAANNSALWFFLTWFPTYLVKYRHLDFIKAGFFSSLPFLAAFFGIIASGLFSDYLLRRGCTATVARKAPMITGLLCASTIVGANYVDHPWLIILFLTLAGFGSGLSSIAWVFVSALAPKRLVGLTGGMFNFFGNLAAIIVPLGIGLLVHGNDFAPGLLFVSALTMTGALSYIFIVGRVERVE